MSAPTARKGFYGTSPDTFVACSPAEACVGDSKCSAGYTGEMCVACEAGYYRSTGECLECGGLATLGAVYAVVAVVGLCAGLVVANYNEVSEFLCCVAFANPHVTHYEHTIHFVTHKNPTHSPTNVVNCRVVCRGYTHL